MTDDQFLAWLRSDDKIITVLIEAQATFKGTGRGGVFNVDTTLYMSTKGGYTTGAGDVPANEVYLPIASVGVLYTEEIPLDSQNSLAAGEIKISNYNGVRDAWRGYIWSNKPVLAYVGDPRWPRSDFRLIFSGVAAKLAPDGKNGLILQLRDKMQLLNTPMIEDPIGGTGPNKDAIKPLSFGEVVNITPVLEDPATLTYRCHATGIEGVIEARSNAAPLDTVVDNHDGTFTLTADPLGTVTCSVQGDKGDGTYRNTIAALIQRIVTGFGKATTRFQATTTLAPGRYDYANVPMFKSFNRASTATYMDATGALQTAAVDTPRMENGQLVIEAAATNIQKNSEAGTGWSFVGSGTGVTVTNGASYLGLVCGKIDFDTTVTPSYAGSHVNNSNSFPVVINNYYAWSAYLALSRALTGSEAISVYITGSSGTTTYVLNASNCAPNAGKWARISTTSKIVVSGSDYFVVYVSGTLTSPLAVYTTRLQCEQVTSLADKATSYIPTTGAAVTRAADVAVLYDDIDGENFGAFEVAHPQPVGLFAKDRTNVIAACNQLAASVGAYLLPSRLGQLQLYQLQIPAPGTPTVIQTQHMVEKSFKPVEYIDVVGAVKLGYCQNYTVQTNLTTGIPEEHKALFSRQWRMVTKQNAQVLSDYKLEGDPVQQDTCFIRLSDADPEAQRQLDLWSVPRTIYEFEGKPEMLMLEIGKPVTVTHPRYGFQNGVTGTVISLAPNWDNGHTTVRFIV